MSTEIIVLTDKSIVYHDLEIKVGDVVNYCDIIVTIVGFEKRGEWLDAVVDGYVARRSISVSEIKASNIIRGITKEELEDTATAILSGNLSVKSLEEPEVTETGLLVMGVDLYKSMKDKQEMATRRMNAIKSIIDKRTQAMRWEINAVVDKMNKMIKRLNNIIFTLELYAGIKENIKQIQSGKGADDKEPIFLNQIMRFMDEEVGDPDNGGISYNSIDKFDDWLLSKSDYFKCFHYELLIPQKKGVRIMRVRRNISEKYSRDTYNNYWSILQEMQTYIIIRNGENLYTIESQMKFSTKLFPDESELAEIFGLSDEDAKYDKLEKYKHGMILMQGLVDRTLVFGEMFGKINFLNTSSVDSGTVVFQYEMDDNLLADGTKTFLDFLNTTTIKAGDRIVINGASGSKDRFARYYASDYNIPDPPQNGIYKLEFDSKSERLYISYNPKDIVYTNWRNTAEVRKNNITYTIYPTDPNIANIDSVSHRDIEWLNNMMYNRRDRKNYLRAFGLLKVVKEFKNLELEQERPFLLMIISYCNVSELDALDAIHWWKTKNKHKRALTVDDKKALRMITKKLDTK